MNKFDYATQKEYLEGLFSENEITEQEFQYMREEYLAGLRRISEQAEWLGQMFGGEENE